MDNIPKDATHYTDTYGYIGYWRVEEYSYSRELCRWFVCWHWWNGKEWQKEMSVNTDKLIPIENNT